MSFDNRLKSLEERHYKMEEQIHAEMVKPSMNADLIRDLKREKLKLKDEISNLRERAA